ncbi:MAG: hypothetical protein [Bacteriophage sp.]|nr:MAG: hypothetical protein [Bacteriophage sp.]
MNTIQDIRAGALIANGMRYSFLSWAQSGVVTVVIRTGSKVTTAKAGGYGYDKLLSAIEEVIKKAGLEGGLTPSKVLKETANILPADKVLTETDRAFSREPDK